MDKLINKRTDRNPASKVVKTKKDITSKIVSGASEKSSTMTIVKSRQPSIVSRASTKQRNFSTNMPRSETSSTTRSSKLSFAEDKQQQSAHRLSHLRGKRPVTTDGRPKLKPTESPMKTNLKKQVKDSNSSKTFPRQYGSKALLKSAPKKPNDPPTAETTKLDRTVDNLSVKTDPTDSGMRTGCPPCEGEASGAATLQQEALLRKELELNEIHGKMHVLEAKCERLETDCKRKQEQISELEAVVSAKTGVIGELENDIQKLGQTVEGLRLTSNSRDAVVRDGLQEVEHKMGNLRKELSQKCNELVKCNGKVWILNERVEELKAELDDARGVLKKKETQIVELLEKGVDQDSIIEKHSRDIEDYRQHSEMLTQRINLLTQEMADKDALITTLKMRGLRNIQTELEPQMVPNENNLLTVAANWTRVEGCEVLYQNLPDKQFQSAEEAQIINDIERNNRKCRAVRDKMLKMLKQFKKENRQMREIIRNNSGQNDLRGSHEKIPQSDCNLKDQLLNQVCRLFPGEPVLQLMQQNNAEE